MCSAKRTILLSASMLCVNSFQRCVHRASGFLKLCAKGRFLFWTDKCKPTRACRKPNPCFTYFIFASYAAVHCSACVLRLSFFWTKYVIVRRISSKNIFTIFIIKIHFFGMQDLWTKHHLMKENLSAKYLVPTLFAMTILMVPKPVNFCQLCNLVLGLELMFEEKNLASDTLNYIMCPRNRIS